MRIRQIFFLFLVVIYILFYIFIISIRIVNIPKRYIVMNIPILTYAFGFKLSSILKNIYSKEMYLLKYFFINYAY